MIVGDALREHRFSGAGRADHQKVVTAGDGDFDRALDGLLAFNVREIDVVVLMTWEKRAQIVLDRRERPFAL